MVHICAQNNLKKMAKICLLANCNINAANNDGKTPLDICDKLQFKAMGDWLIFMGGENGFCS
jgi:ankyrin repeat protein